MPNEAFEIEVSYNGVSRSLTVRPEEDVQAVLEAAIRLFAVQQQPHQLGMFTEANVQVAGRPADNGPEIHQSVEQAGICAWPCESPHQWPAKVPALDRLT